MKAEANISYTITGNELSKLVREMSQNLVIDKFYHVMIGTKLAAQMHNIAEPTLRKYVRLGLITPQEENPLRFRMSDVLRWDFSEMREMAAGIRYAEANTN